MRYDYVNVLQDTEYENARSQDMCADTYTIKHGICVGSGELYG